MNESLAFTNPFFAPISRKVLKMLSHDRASIFINFLNGFVHYVEKKNRN